MNSSDSELLTPNGYSALQQEIHNLENIEIPEITKAIAIAREHGDLSENAEYHTAKEKRSMLDASLQRLHTIERNVRVINSGDIVQDGKIRFGSFLELLNTEKETTMHLRIVGEYEASHQKEFLSYKSPLGTQLLGKIAGDTVQQSAITFEVLRVHYDE